MSRSPMGLNARIGARWAIGIAVTTSFFWLPARCARAAAQNPPAGQESAQPVDENLKKLSLEQLGSVEVTTVSKEPETVWQTPAAVYVLSQDDIRKAGVNTIPEALRLIPGVEVARIDSDHWAIGVRGFGSQFSRSLLVLIDGRSVYTPLFAGVYWDVQDTTIEDIDQIEAIRGPGGTIWSANAVDGIINIITKNAKDTHGALVSVGGGNVDQGIGEVRYGGGNGKTFDYRVYGKAFSLGPEFHVDGNDYDKWSQQRGGFRMDWNKHDRDTITLQGDIYHGEDGDTTTIGSFFPPSQVTLDGNDSVSGGNILGRWKRQFSERSDMQLQAYYDRTDRQARQYGEIRNTFDVDFLHHIKLPARQELLWGLGARVSPGDFMQAIPTLNFLPQGRQTDSIYSAFVQDEIHIVPDRFSLTLGTKIERNNYTGFEVEPSARLLWSVTPRQTLWAAVTRAVRSPSRLDTELQLQDFLLFLPPTRTPVYLEVAGNPKFASESLIGYEAGYRSLITPNFYVDLSTFFDDYQKLSSFSPATASIVRSPIAYELFTISYINGIKGTTRGFEIAPDWKATPWFELKGSYSYLYPHLTENSAGLLLLTAPTDNGSSPRNESVVQPFFTLPRHTELDLTYRYVGALPGQDVKAYSTGDVRAGWHATDEVEFSVTGENLLQPQHAEFGLGNGVFVNIKRSVFAKITWTQKPR